jgi:hypothetical protein
VEKLFVRLNEKLMGLESRLETRFDEKIARLETLESGMETRFKTLETGMETVGSGLKTLETEMETRLKNIENNMISKKEMQALLINQHDFNRNKMKGLKQISGYSSI